MLTDPSRHFAEVSARRHVRFDLLLREVFCAPNTPNEPASTGLSQPSPAIEPAEPQHRPEQPAP